jgi:hypothetical protein
MANAGKSRDWKFIVGYYKDRTWEKITNVPIYPEDDQIQILLKNKINSYHKARCEDKIIDWNIYFGGRLKYPTIKYSNKYLDMETKLNQIRLKHWYWKPINYDLYN